MKEHQSEMQLWLSYLLYPIKNTLTHIIHILFMNRLLHWFIEFCILFFECTENLQQLFNILIKIVPFCFVPWNRQMVNIVCHFCFDYHISWNKAINIPNVQDICFGFSSYDHDINFYKCMHFQMQYCIKCRLNSNEWWKKT